MKNGNNNTRRIYKKIWKYKGHNIMVMLEGNIDKKIDMNLSEVNKEDDNIEIIFNKTKRKICGEKLKIDIHQIKNIESDEDTEFYIYFDSNQRIIFLIDMDVFFNYNLQKWENRLLHK